MTDILKAVEVAELLRVSKSQVYELCKLRTQSGDIREHPLPCVCFGKLVRFRRADVETWLDKLATKKQVQ